MKKDLRNEIKNRKFHKTIWPFYIIYKVVMDIVMKKYNCKYTRIADIGKSKGACFVLFNHQSRIDHAYVMQMCWPRRMNMISQYSEFFRSHLYFAFKHNNVLPKKNYTSDLTCIKAIMRMVKQGGCIAMAPEGLCSNDGLNRPIVPGTGDFLKKIGIPVYFVKLEGCYLQNTKVCLKERYGNTYATSSLLFSVDDLKNKSGAEIDNQINEAFKFDEYAWQKEKRIKWNMEGNSCERLEDLIFECPKCHKLFTTIGKKDSFTCTNCHNGFDINEYYELIPHQDSIVPSSISDYSKEERIHIIKEIKNNDTFEFVEEVRLGNLPNNHLIKDHKTAEVVGSGKFIINHDGVSYIDNKDESLNFKLTYKEIYTVITVVDSSYFSFYVKGEYCEITPKNKTALYMWMLIEEMHRLHVNTYKNFTWNNYMYE